MTQLTNLLSDPQIIAALLTVALTAFAGIGGYLLRERVNRVTPFMAITNVDGDTRRFGTRVEIPAQVNKSMASAAIQSPLAETAALPDIANALMMATELRDRGADFLELVRQFRTAATSNDSPAAQAVLFEIMIDEVFDHWLSVIIGEREVVIPAFDPNAPIQIECGEERNVRGGTYSVGFPGRSLRFGSDLNDFALYKAGVASFLELVQRMELKKLSDVLDAICAKVTNDISVAKDIAPTLQGIVDEHSQWCVRIYVANLGTTPFLIQRDGVLEIRDKNGGRYSENCSLILIEASDEDGDERIEALSPLVVRSESDVTFEFVTDATQSEMAAGGALRALYQAGSAECFVRFEIDRPGIKRTHELRTPPVPFRGA